MANEIAKTLKGFRDFLPEQEIARRKFIETIKRVYETFGFSPLETPVLEYADILTGKYGDEGEKLMYRFKDQGDRDVAMRYDLTIPLARVMAQYPELKKPFKRYQVSPVWRAENTQKGRFREFYQCDADIVGSESPLADAEILALASEVTKALKLDVVLRINSRKILNAFYGSLGLDEKVSLTILRIVDKLEKIGKGKVIDEIVSLGIKKDISEQIVAFADTKIKDIDDIDAVANKYPMISSVLKELGTIVYLAQKMSVFEYEIDFSIARGLDYYTGLIFETNLKAIDGYGSILSGGRYDNLIGLFGKNSIPAVGASVGIDRLFSALLELGLVKIENTVAKVLVLNIDETLVADYTNITKILRDGGVPTMLYFDTNDIKKQLSFASGLDMKCAVILGGDEKKSGLVVVKDLTTGKQESVSISEIVNTVKKIVG